MGNLVICGKYIMVEQNMVDMRFDSYLFSIGRKLSGRFGMAKFTPRVWRAPDSSTVGDYVASSSWRYARVQHQQSVYRSSLPRSQHTPLRRLVHVRASGLLWSWNCTAVSMAMGVLRQQDATSLWIKRGHGATSAGEVCKKSFDWGLSHWFAWLRTRSKTNKRRAVFSLRRRCLNYTQKWLCSCGMLAWRFSVFTREGGICVSAVFAPRVVSRFSKSDASPQKINAASLSWRLLTVPCVFSTKKQILVFFISGYIRKAEGLQLRSSSRRKSNFRKEKVQTFHSIYFPGCTTAPKMRNLGLRMCFG